jgi:quinol monooxygenase YgiN
MKLLPGNQTFFASSFDLPADQDHVRAWRVLLPTSETVMTDPLIVFARVTPKPEYLDAARLAILDIVPQTLAEPGCRAFSVHADREVAEHLYLYEVWDDAAALEAHHAQPYTRAVFARYENWLASPVEITKLRRLDAGRSDI